MGKLLDIVINWLWENFLKSIFAKLDRWDVLVLALLSISGVALWSWVTRFNFTEKLLWISFFVALGLIWLAIRKLPSRDSWAIKNFRVPFLAIKIILILGLAAIWGYARFQVYRIPSFAKGVTGFYVARFENDPNDDYQNKIIDYLEEEIRLNGLPSNIQVARLPRVVDEMEAQKMGEKGGAALVLWGKVFSYQVRSYLAIVNAKGVFQSTASVGGGSSLSGDLAKLELPLEIKTLEEVLGQFFVGYSSYHNSNYKRAHDFFEAAKTKLTPLVQKQQGLTPEKATLGSINFYQGNTNFFLGDLDRAIEAYLMALELTSRPADKQPLYIEPLNNLAFLEKQKGKLDDAINHLLLASETCEKEPSMVCVSVAYNLGSAYIEQSKYQEAVTTLQRATKLCASIEAEQRQGKPDKRLMGFTHQNLAYSYVKMGDNSNGEQSTEFYGKSEQELNEATGLLKDIEGGDPMSSLNLIHARIYVGLKQYDAALKALKEVRITKTDESNVNLLFAVAYKCKGEIANSSDYLNRFKPNVPKDTQEGFEYFKKQTGTCQ